MTPELGQVCGVAYAPEQQLGELAALPSRLAAHALRQPTVVPAELVTRNRASGQPALRLARQLGCGQPTELRITIGRLDPSTLLTS